MKEFWGRSKLITGSELLRCTLMESESKLLLNGSKLNLVSKST